MNMKTQQASTNKTAYSYVRFSTAEQQLGDSERRQLAAAEAWCERNGYRLADTYADKGKSAFHGRNHTSGNLGALLKTMKPGQLLLIEDTDRWSREDPLDALTRLRAEVERGIEVVFLRTGQRVTRANFSDMSVVVPNFFGSLLANQESAKKAERIKAVWDAKKASAASGKPTRFNRLPCWLVWDEQAGKAVVIEHKAAVVREMFALACAGHGFVDISRAMVKGNVPPIVTSKHPVWNPASVKSVLTNRALCGYYTPKDGAPVAGVWPVILDQTTYDSAQYKLDVVARDKRPGHASESNLFTGLATCSKCGRNLIANGTASHRPRLVCGGAARGQSDCGMTGAPLDLIEKSLFGFMAHGDFTELLVRDKQPSKLDELQARHAGAEKLAAKLAKVIIHDSDPDPAIYAALKQARADAASIRGEMDRARAEESTPAEESYQYFTGELLHRLKDPAARPELRRAVNSIIQGITLDTKGTAEGWQYRVTLRSGEWAEINVSRTGQWSYSTLGHPVAGQYWPPVSAAA